VIMPLLCAECEMPCYSTGWKAVFDFYVCFTYVILC